MKRIIIAGGTGYIGRYLMSRFLQLGYDVFLVSRNPGYIQWDTNELTQAFEGALLVINLAGKSINCRHSIKNRKKILSSRINTTQMIGNAIKSCKNPPLLWINSSASGIYQSSDNKPMTEVETVFGTDYLAEVSIKWEKTFFDFELPFTRQIAVRTSVVLGKNGGALEPLKLLTRMGLGGKQASGNQMFSWIHLEDYFQIICFALKNNSLTGIINCTSPNPLSNNNLMSELRRILQVPFGLNAPKILIQLGAFIIGTESKLILNSNYIIPKRLIDAGFKFTYPDINSAISNLVT